ncbi:MAG: thermonuclease family protein, partial [Mesorhizobium sp.]|nr:thermonuclease family protein [Mesorhizobium sp.]
KPDRDPPRNVVRVIPLKAQPRDTGSRPGPAPARNGEGAVPDKAPDRTIVGAIPRPTARIVPICGGGAHVTCVVDGDTFWLDGEKIRIAGIDAPEIKGKCRSEKTRAAEATRRLRDILSGAAITLERTGKDKYGRTLAHVRVGAGEAGRMLVDEGLARAWTGKKEGWC